MSRFVVLATLLLLACASACGILNGIGVLPSNDSSDGDEPEGDDCTTLECDCTGDCDCDDNALSCTCNTDNCSINSVSGVASAFGDASCDPSGCRCIGEPCSASSEVASCDGESCTCGFGVCTCEQPDIGCICGGGCSDG